MWLQSFKRRFSETIFFRTIFIALPNWALRRYPSSTKIPLFIFPSTLAAEKPVKLIGAARTAPTKSKKNNFGLFEIDCAHKPALPFQRRINAAIGGRAAGGSWGQLGVAGGSWGLYCIIHLPRWDFQNPSIVPLQPVAFDYFLIQVHSDLIRFIQEWICSLCMEFPVQCHMKWTFCCTGYKENGTKWNWTTSVVDNGINIQCHG